ncbi:MAG: TonB-dependent receptor [Acidobacteriota bacterium]
MFDATPISRVCSLLLALVLSASLVTAQAEPIAPASFDLADLELLDLEATDLTGQVLLLDFWATWCAPCLAQMPELDDLWTAHRDEGFAVIGVALDTMDRRSFESFLDRHDITWPQSLEARTFDAQIATQFQVTDLPRNALVARDGRVVALDVELDALDTLLPELLAEARTDEPPAAETATAFSDELVVTATRTLKRRAETPVLVQTIDRELIEVSASRTVADAVEWTPGVRVESNCQNCNFSQVRILGLEGPYSQILVDGQPTVSSLASVYGVEQFPARLIDNIEVVKGGGAALYGPGAVGGVINLIPHTPSATSLSVDAGLQSIDGESGYSISALADWANADATTSISIFGQADQVDPVDVDGDGFTEVTQRSLLTGGIRALRYMLDSRARLSAEINVTDAERRGGALDGIDGPPDNTALAEDIATERRAGGLTWLHTVNKRFDYRLTASWADTDRDSYYGAGFDPNAYGTTDNPLFMTELQANHYGDRGTITWGAAFANDEIDDRQPGYDRRIVESNENASLFIQDDRKIGTGVTLLYGVRVDDHSTIDDPILSPRAALLYSPRPALTFRLTAAQGFRPPSTFDEDLHIELVGGGVARVIRNAPDLVEEKSTAYLASAEWLPTVGRKGTAALVIDLFRTELDDLFNNIENDDLSTPELEILRINAGRATVQGIELTAAYRYLSRFEIEASFVVQTARFDEPEPDFGSRDFFRTPEQYGNLFVRTQLPWDIDLFAGLRYTGSMKAPHFAGFITEDRLETTPSFLTLDLTASRTFELAGRELSLQLGVKNLTDEYQDDLDQGPDRDSNYVYGPRFPRTVVVGVGFEL